MIRTIILFVFTFLLQNVFSQGDSITLVRYTPEFRFKDGVYLNFDMVKKNTPISKSRIITNRSYSDFNFFDEIFEEDKISYYDFIGIKKEIKTSEMWGYSNNGTLFINWNDAFNRIPVMGSLCHFIANKTVYDTRAYDPYTYGGYYSYRYYHNQPATTSTEMRQYILNFNTGEILDFDNNSLLVMLMGDPELYEEYNNLRAKKQRKMKFFYLRKFNERNPLYLPISNGSSDNSSN